jgi:hypothetical protein
MLRAAQAAAAIGARKHTAYITPLYCSLWVKMPIVDLPGSFKLIQLLTIIKPEVVKYLQYQRDNVIKQLFMQNKTTCDVRFIYCAIYICVYTPII